MGRSSALALGFVLIAGPASGCINDVELPTHEREFRSQYTRTGPTRSTPAATPYPARHWLLIGSGSTLLACGLAVALLGGRARA